MNAAQMTSEQAWEALRQLTRDYETLHQLSEEIESSAAYKREWKRWAKVFAPLRDQWETECAAFDVSGKDPEFVRAKGKEFLTILRDRKASALQAFPLVSRVDDLRAQMAAMNIYRYNRAGTVTYHKGNGYGRYDELQAAAQNASLAEALAEYAA